MKIRLTILLRTAVFWIAFMFAVRFIFMFYNNNLAFELSFIEWIKVFIYGLRMDLSASGYFLAILCLILTISIPFKGKIIKFVILFFHYIFLVFSSVVAIADIELYRNWGFRMDATPLLYITKPKEAMASTNTWLSILLVAVTIFIVLAAGKLYKKYVVLKINRMKPTQLYFIPVFLVITGSMILPIRGSLGIAPMNIGMVYHSNNQFANHSAINVIWNVGDALTRVNSVKNEYRSMSDEVSDSIFHTLNIADTASIKIIDRERPNIAIIILESFTSKLIEPLGGEKGITPNLNELTKQGVLFSNFYANSDRSDKGLVSIISGFPTHPTKSIIKFPGKSRKLPYITHSLHKEGYNSAFYYGGDLDFANMRSYISNAEFQELITKDNFDSDLNYSKWGVHDGPVFEKFYDDLTKAQEPFLKVFFTLSSHDPFDVPMKTVIEGKDDANRFRNSIYYTDSCLGNFFDKIKETKVWDNTLFILIADHGSTRPGNSPVFAQDKFQIPMLWTGGVVNNDTTISKLGMQIDLSKTLLNQLNLESDKFVYANDILTETNDTYALYTFNNGFGYITDSSYVVYGKEQNDIIDGRGNGHQNILLENGKAYIQYLVNDFINK